MTRSLFLSITLLLGAFSPASAKPSLGMWVWTQDAITTREERQKLLTFCTQEGITHLDQSIKTNNSVVQNPDALKQLLTQSHSRGITINALRGDPKMFFKRNHAKTIADLRTLITFNHQLPPTSRLNGIKYDVEPYLTPEWKAGGKQQQQVILDYLNCLQQIKTILTRESPDLLLSADVPFWWDKPEFAVTFAGQPKPFVNHIQDLTDHIGIMSYRTSSIEVLDLVTHELTYATKIGKTISPGLETIDLKETKPRVSFFGTPPALLRKTIRELQTNLSENKAARHIMLHHHGSLVPYLNQPEPTKFRKK
ncbi:MAG: hypothetical protein ACSHYF_05070 [Verrucomicrobiaceae bacterium]